MLPFEIIYAINDNPKYVLMVKNSLRSLRRFNSSRPVSIYVYGETDPAKGFDAFKNVRCFLKPKLHPSFNTYLKWYAIIESAAQTALFLDADTIVFDDVDKLLKAKSNAQFYARQEIGTQNKKGTFTTGCYSLRYQLDHGKMSSLAKKYKTKPLPFFFNSGVMLIKSDLIEKIRSKFGDLAKIKSLLEIKMLENPTSNEHILEEVAANLFLATLQAKSERLPTEKVPFYFEYKSGLYDQNKAVVTHVLSNFYPHALKDLSLGNTKPCLSKEQLTARLKKKLAVGQRIRTLTTHTNIVLYVPNCRARTLESLKQKVRFFSACENVYVLSPYSAGLISKFMAKKMRLIRIPKGAHPLIAFIENIRRMEGKQWLFMDVFCVNFKEITSFLKKYAHKNVFGVEYKSATASPYDYYLGNSIFEPLLYKPALDEISAYLGSLPEKVFGSQLLVINGRANQKILKKIHELKIIVEYLKTEHVKSFNQVKYLENYALGIFLRKNKDISSGYVSSEDFINYMQLKSGEYPLSRYMLGTNERSYSEISRL